MCCNAQLKYSHMQCVGMMGLNHSHSAKQKETHSGVHFVWHIELLAGVHNDWSDGWIVSVAYTRKEMVHHLQKGQLADAEQAGPVSILDKALLLCKHPVFGVGTYHCHNSLHQAVIYSCAINKYIPFLMCSHFTL